MAIDALEKIQWVLISSTGSQHIEHGIGQMKN